MNNASQETPRYKVGDRIKILRVGMPLSDATAVRRHVGKTGTIKRITHDSAAGFDVYRLNNIPGEWFEDELEAAS